MEQHQLKKGFEKDFILGGRAILTVRSERSGKHFTYKVKETSNNKNSYFISVKNSSDTFLYIGILKKYFGKWELILTAKSRVGKDAVSYKTFQFIIDRYINRYSPHSEMSLFHSGRCSKCDRELTDPESIELGMGPICRNLKY